MRSLLALVLLLNVPSVWGEEFDVLIYGGTPAGIAAAIASAKDGERVLLVEPNSWVGGAVTNGLTHADFRTFEGLNGAFLDFSKRIEAHYRKTYGANSPQLRESLRGTQTEPKVARAIFEQMLAEEPRVKVWLRHTLEAVECSTDRQSRAVEILLFVNERGERRSVAARFFIDATYEGDLMAAVGVPYRVGREGRDELGESLAPEQPDAQLQGYSFRLTMTRDPEKRVALKSPRGYQREDYIGVLPLLESGKITAVFGMKSSNLIKATLPPLPNGKFDINDMSRGPVRLSLPGKQLGWADGEGGTVLREGVSPGFTTPPFSRLGLAGPRKRIFDEHLHWEVGLLYFLQNDEAVPAKFRDEAREWGLCKDEYAENAHLPEQIYVREARRMTGSYVFTEKDTDQAAGSARAAVRPDSIAIGDYGPNCHGTGHEGGRFGGQHTGEFYKRVAPYQIPYGVLVPRDVENLLVPGAVSSSHVGFCALRLEPIWMSLGQASGHAAHLALKRKVMAQQVPVPELQARLHAVGAATVYVSDVPPGHRDFAMVQWWGTMGGLHAIAPAQSEPGLRGKNIAGQYYEAFPGHSAEPDKILDPELATAWRKLAEELGLPIEKLPQADGKLTRSRWLRAAFARRPRSQEVKPAPRTSAK